MNDANTIKKLVKKFSDEMISLEKERDKIMDRISGLAFKIDTLKKTLTVFASEGIIAEEELSQTKNQQREGYRGDSKGMTAETLKLLKEAGHALTTDEIMSALEVQGFKTKRVNVYIMLKRLEASSRITLIEKDNEPKKFRFAYPKEDRIIR